MDSAGDFISMAQQVIAAYGLKVIAAIAIFIIGKWLSGLLSRAVGKAMRRTGTDEMLVKFVVSIAHVAMLAFVVLAALAQLGIQTTSFIAVLGAAGLAVGLALQGSLSNFAAGVMLIVFRPFKVGDYIEAAGTAGSVEEIMIFSTKLRSPDNKELYVPNGSILSGTIVNYSAKNERRVDLVFGCGYGDDIKKAKALLEAIVRENPLVLSDPEPTIGVLALGESSVDFAVRPWVKTADYWTAHFQITEAVKQRFDEEGLSIPFPQRDVHVINSEAA
ncbi:MAG: mechanosensitive ion channel [Gammaproteobacteria bacterium]|nr:mechanosensitive ion channel [Gammaproteobacteria bacterium]NIM73559.1 mechanosensitive ion channel [Gammaproteobacteria bacterium]NIN39968.1 mechanosensitive ion channel [Gammaproteobacteria bacterium]NIO25368.1 mechanosensitive ion channel [Gammaproteobacteria bacterium]NIO65995.1 mechanosensitive ion channel [Gammaproteobacteria bacterium]